MEIEKIEQKYDEYNIAIALQEIWTLISRTNKYIDETLPWTLAKEEQTEKLESVIYHLIENLRKIAIVILPVMENTGREILRQLGIEEESLKSWESLNKYNQITNAKVIEKGEPLFMRLNTEEEIDYLKSAMKS